jgi:hypothetical protein
MLFQKFKEDWSIHGITIMSDLWMGPTGMCIINFMIYCNGNIVFTNQFIVVDTVRTRTTFLGGNYFVANLIPYLGVKLDYLFFLVCVGNRQSGH